MKNILSAIIVLIILIHSHVSSAVNFAWAKNAGSSSSATVLVRSMAVDANGNVYSTGTISGTADFDPGPGMANLTGNGAGQDIYVQKLDPLGNLLWAKILSSGSSYSESITLKLDNSNNVCIVGTFDATVDFDPGPNVSNVSPQGDQDAFVLKLSSAGTFSWVKTFGDPVFLSFTYGNGLAIDNADNVIVSGSFESTIDFDPGPGVSNLSPLSFQDAFILKLSSAGNFVWVKSLQVSDFAMSSSLDVDASGNIYAGGTYTGTIDLDPGSAMSSFSSALNVQFVYLVKLNASGSYVFGKSFGGTDYSELTGLRVSSSKQIILTGLFYGQNDFDPGPGTSTIITSAGFQDGFISKLDSNGNFLWAKHFGGNADLYLMSADIDTLGNVYSTGYLTGTTDFDPGTGTVNLTNSGYADVFVSKLTSGGGFISVNQLGSTGPDGGFDIKIKNNSIYSTGMFNNTVDFDPSASTYYLTALATPFSDGDIYCFKWDQCIPSTYNFTVSACSYTLNGINYTGNGSYTQVLTNSTGCDSIITLTLINSANTVYMNATSCTGSYTYNGQTYTMSGNYTQSYVNAYGCDSSTHINLTLGSTTFSTQNVNACDFYLFNGNFYTSSGTYIDTLINASGCNDIVTLNLTIYPSTSNVITVNTCGSYVFNGTTYSSTGFYTNSFISVNGCDSTVYLDLTITPLPNTVISQSSCTPYTWNGITYSVSGNYSHLYTSATGCDSTVILNLTINTPNINVTQSGLTLISAASAPSTWQWIKCNPYTIIPGAIGQSYMVTANGDYAVIINLNGCKDTSNCKSVIGIGIDENYLNNLVKIYPNPTEDLLNIEFEQNMKNLSVKLISMTGQVLLEKYCETTDKIVLHTSHLAKGVYILMLNDGEHQSEMKFTKK